MSLSTVLRVVHSSGGRPVWTAKSSHDVRMSDDSDIEASVNQVLLRGRLAGSAETKTLPSGDVMVVFRLTVDRPVGDRGRVDSLECVTTRNRPRRTLERCAPGDVVEVSGSLRRRFWRGPGGLASRYAVDVTSARVVRRAGSATGRAGAASRAPKQASA